MYNWLNRFLGRQLNSSILKIINAILELSDLWTWFGVQASIHELMWFCLLVVNRDDWRMSVWDWETQIWNCDELLLCDEWMWLETAVEENCVVQFGSVRKVWLIEVRFQLSICLRKTGLVHKLTRMVQFI